MSESRLVQMLQRHEELLKRRESVQSDSSKDQPIFFKPEPPSANQRESEEAARDEGSMVHPLLFKHRESVGESPDALKTDGSMVHPLLFNHSLDEAEFDPKCTDFQEPDPVSVFKELEENIVSFVKAELSRFQKVLSSAAPESAEAEDEDEAGLRQAFLKITVNFLKELKQDKMADLLHNRHSSARCRRQLKARLQRRFGRLSEGVATTGSPAPLQQIYTELYVTEGGASDVNRGHQVRQNEATEPEEKAISCQDIFKRRPRPIRAERAEERPIRAEERPIRAESTERGPSTADIREGGAIRTVLTKGVAGVGKTVLTQKFCLDWAEGRSNQEVQLLLPLTFRELNVLKEQSFSLVELLHHCFNQTKELNSFEDLQLLFILDGLDECRLQLDFTRTRTISDPTERGSLEELLVNLIRGDLLPSSQLWITTRPAAANQIPAQCVSMVTEVRGFSDLQKEQYFRKRISDAQQATAVIAHIKSVRSLFIMCYIPIFCWILFRVLEHLLKSVESPELPHTLTNLYIHLLVVLFKQKNLKYHGRDQAEPAWSEDNRQMVWALSKLAWEQLQKGKLIFSQAELSERGLQTSVDSGLMTEVYRDEPGQGQDKVFCFLHLSVQEFMAALHVHQSFLLTGANLLQTGSPLSRTKSFRSTLESLHCSAVDQALQSPSGHLDLFLRFLLGLGLQENHRLLRDLLPLQASPQETQRLLPQAAGSPSSRRTVAYIRQKLDLGTSPERGLNLLHCLNELNERSLLQQLQAWLSAGELGQLGELGERELSPAQWTALSFILLSSDSDLQHFDLRSFCPDDRALLGLRPLLRAAASATLSCCSLTSLSCPPVASVLTSSSLTVLDLSNNDLGDSGVKDLCVGLHSATCRLETLSLSGCLLSEVSCKHLSSALVSGPSHLKHLDLSYNHPGEGGARLLQAVRSSGRKLDSLRLEPSGPQWLKPGLTKYAQELSWDPLSLHRRLRVSDSRSTVMLVNEPQNDPEHPLRFSWFYQVLCEQELSGRCYFQVRWSGAVRVGVAYRSLQRKGRSSEAVLGGNDGSWCLSCSDRGFSVWHQDQETRLALRPRPHMFKAVAVLVDPEAGQLSFFSLSPRLTLLHSFSSVVFSEPIVPAFSFDFDCVGSTVSLCPA